MLFKVFLAVSLPAMAFLAVWRVTEHWFWMHRLPLPFERYGAVLGAGAAFWMLGLVLLVWHFWEKRRG